MKCLNCGTENEDRARFCSRCGAALSVGAAESPRPEAPFGAVPPRPEAPFGAVPPRPEAPFGAVPPRPESPFGAVGGATMPHKKPKKKKGFLIWLIILVSVIVISLLTVGGVWYVNANSPYNKNVKLGYDLLNEGRYEEAIIAFDEAIEIDARKPKAYIGKADTYATRADENAVADIEDTFTEATEQNEKNIDTIIEETIRLADFFKSNGYEQYGIDLLEGMYELFEDDRLRQKADEHFEAYYKSVLMELYNSGEDAIKEFLFGDEIKYIVSRMSESDCFWYSENGDLSEDGSMGIGLYPDELLYVGGWYDGMFDGNGKYYVLSDDGENYNTFEGEFLAGVPNGQATMICEFVNGYYNSNVDYTYVREEHIGNYVDGICDGEFEIRAITDSGEVHAVVDPKVTYVDGVAQKIKDFSGETYIAGEVPGTTLVWTSDGSVEYAPMYPRDESIKAVFEKEVAEEVAA